MQLRADKEVQAMFKKAEHNIVLAGFILSAVLLTGFSLSKNFDLRYLNLPQAWFFVSAIPTILALFVGGFIRKGSFAGVEFEVSSEKATELVIPATADIVANVPDMVKGTFNELKKLTRDQRRNIKILNFNQIWADEYREDIIFQYFEALLNLSYFRIIREGRPSQYLSVNALRSFCFPRQPNDVLSQDREDAVGWPTSMDRFLWALRDDRILSEYAPYASELTVSSDQDLEDILREMYSQNVEFAAVYSNDQSFLGIIEAKSIERHIGKSFIKRK